VGATGRGRSRGLRWLGALALVVTCLGALEAIPGVPGHDRTALALELVASDGQAGVSKLYPFLHPGSREGCADLEATFGVGNHLLKNTELGFYASVWPTYQALAYFEVQSLRPGASHCSADLAQTLAAVSANDWADAVAGSPGAYDQGPRAFHVASDLPRVDDSLWMGLATVFEYARTKDPSLLRRAQDVFRLATANWDPKAGGIYWEDHTSSARDDQKSVVSNAPAALLGVDLYRLTGRRSYLEWSERIVGWLETNLVDPRSGLYDDGLTDHAGRVVRRQATYTYDQGIVIGVLAALAQVDPQRYPLAGPVDLAHRAMDYFGSRRHAYGQPGFDVIWAENLLSVACLYHHRAFDVEARQAVRLALRSEPKGTSDLLTSASEATLQTLTQLPIAALVDQFYSVPLSPQGSDRPGGCREKAVGVRVDLSHTVGY